LEPAVFPTATLKEFYRLALLLAGDVYSAQQLLATCLADVEAHLDELRSSERRRWWMARRMRQQCLAQGADMDPLPSAPRLIRDTEWNEAAPEVLKIEAYIVAQRFHQLPEPERSALALFYLDLFSTEEITQLLGMSLDELATVLTNARALLQAGLRPVEPTSVTT
jgi:DNA-directed RNA polymerase specialized sigma24 family protein